MGHAGAINSGGAGFPEMLQPRSQSEEWLLRGDLDGGARWVMEEQQGLPSATDAVGGYPYEDGNGAV